MHALTERLEEVVGLLPGADGKTICLAKRQSKRVAMHMVQLVKNLLEDHRKTEGAGCQLHLVLPIESDGVSMA